jgi:uncharacterized membrane protein (UPF0127 family)
VRSLQTCRVRVDTFVFIYKTPDTVVNRTDTTLCKTGSVVLRVADTVATWDDGFVGSEKIITAPGVYYAYTQSADKCTFSLDSFRVAELDISFDLGNVTVICGSQPYVLTPKPMYEDVLLSKQPVPAGIS